MWIAHFAPGLVAKPLAPSIPLWLLALAGALPDAAFFVLRGCFPYATNYPVSHSLLGMAVLGTYIIPIIVFDIP